MFRISGPSRSLRRYDDGLYAAGWIDDGHPAGFATGGMAVQHFAVGGMTAMALARAGVPLSMVTQGEYSNSVAASAGTHSGGGVVDIAAGPGNGPAMVARLRAAGFAAWLRTPAEGFSYHIHACAIGDREIASGAARQVQSYFNGRNGLANNAADPFERRWPNWADKYNQ